MSDFLYENGERIRREVLGEEYVKNSTAATDAFSEPVRAFAIKHLWGDIWDRPGLDRRSRSIINLALMTAMNRPTELKIHIRAALNNGLTREEISEVFLQCALYCGIPAGSESTRVAKQLFAELDG
ncbi:carboxymuconolactone decarboxylase family protein [Pseudomonas fluorescens]|uniref:carboxymuconolactone decarboxylase family protein n=1 Tax=Pseudomonas fluorescens TaxID=294 RepID=UPI00073243BD|nr:carboxymuconolactone decarboxylase family protein [Pseudomonas fluorescens]